MTHCVENCPAERFEHHVMNLTSSHCHRFEPIINRRQLLQRAGGGFGGLALAQLMASQGVKASDNINPLAPRTSHFPAKAKSIIWLFMTGAPSQVDTWDYKPELEKRQGKPFDPEGKLTFFASKPGNCQQSWWKFRQHGDCGRWMSDLFPQLATKVDDMAFIYSMQSKTALHGPGCFMMNTGQTLPGFPSMGAWISYGLGTFNQNLPSFMVMTPVGQAEVQSPQCTQSRKRSYSIFAPSVMTAHSRT